MEATAGSHLGHRGDAGSSAGEHLVVSALFLFILRSSYQLGVDLIGVHGYLCSCVARGEFVVSLVMKSLDEPKLTVASSILAPFRRNDPLILA